MKHERTNDSHDKAGLVAGLRRSGGAILLLSGLLAACDNSMTAPSQDRLEAATAARNEIAIQQGATSGAAGGTTETLPTPTPTPTPTSSSSSSSPSPTEDPSGGPGNETPREPTPGGTPEEPPVETPPEEPPVETPPEATPPELPVDLPDVDVSVSFGVSCSCNLLGVCTVCVEADTDGSAWMTEIRAEACGTGSGAMTVPVALPIVGKTCGAVTTPLSACSIGVTVELDNGHQEELSCNP